MRVKFFNRPRFRGADLPSMAAGIVTIVMALLNIPMPG